MAPRPAVGNRMATKRQRIAKQADRISKNRGTTLENECDKIEKIAFTSSDNDLSGLPAIERTRSHRTLFDESGQPGTAAGITRRCPDGWPEETR